MKLTLGVRMNTNRIYGCARSALARQADRWVSATLTWLRKEVTLKLERGGAWELRVDGADGGTLVVRGTLGSFDHYESIEWRAHLMDAA